jgi:hypothetical protein
MLLDGIEYSRVRRPEKCAPEHGQRIDKQI